VTCPVPERRFVIDHGPSLPPHLRQSVQGQSIPGLAGT